MCGFVIHIGCMPILTILSVTEKVIKKTLTCKLIHNATSILLEMAEQPHDHVN